MQPAQQHHRQPFCGLTHQQSGGGGDFVGHGHVGVLQDVAVTVAFAAPVPDPLPGPDPKIAARAEQAANRIENDDLRAALERLGRNVLSKNTH